MPTAIAKTVQIEGERARAAGRAAYFNRKLGARRDNPYPAGSFRADCWEAGWNQDVRSIEELAHARAK